MLTDKEIKEQIPLLISSDEMWEKALAQFDFSDFPDLV